MTTARGQANFYQRVEDVRRFNRFYTRQIGVLQQGLLQSEYSLTEVRVLYELAHRDQPTATDLARDLNLDAGYLSRILRGFKRQGLVLSQPSTSDGRQSLLSLTKQGRVAFSVLSDRSHAEIAQMLGRLSVGEQNRLLEAMHTVQELLGGKTPPKVAYLLRPHQPGDMGWVVHRHGVLYNQEYGWDESFEALVAEIVAKFIQTFDPKCERCWIAERDGEVVGSVFLVKLSDAVAKLRLLYVEPSARGLGIGKRLVQECTRFARQVGYQRITLWTNSVLEAARGIYIQEGYKLVGEEPHHSFGHDLVGETWELEL